MFSFAKFIVGLSLVAALAACGAGGTIAPAGTPGAATGTKISLTVAENGKTIQVPVGDEVDITLQTIGPGQYANPTVSSPAVRFLGVSLVGPAIPAGPTQLFRFQAAAAGQAIIAIQGAPHNPAFAVTLQTS